MKKLFSIKVIYYLSAAIGFCTTQYIDEKVAPFTPYIKGYILNEKIIDSRLE